LHVKTFRAPAQNGNTLALALPLIPVCLWRKIGPVKPVLCACLLLSVCLPLTPAAQAAAGVASRISSAEFGVTRAGEPVELWTLRNRNGLTAQVLTYGAIIYSLEVPDRNGRFTNIVLNCGTLADYELRSPCFGAVVGRYANRIGGASFTLDGHKFQLPANAGPNNLHGGPRGFDKQVWHAAPSQGKDFVALTLSYTSVDGESGYPGTLRCTVRYELSDRNEWRMEYSATTDKPTPVNLSNHAYWNLAGAQSGDVLKQLLTVKADAYLAADQTLIPTGEVRPVAGTPLDFRQPHAIGQRIGLITGPQFGGGYDHCLVLQHQPGKLSFCARLTDPASGRVMEVFTTQPAVQLFSANFPSGAFHGPRGYPYPAHPGFCLETEHYPDSPNHPQFPSTILRPGQTYHELTIHRFTVAKD
jgi:aldose 1-epimerase